MGASLSSTSKYPKAKYDNVKEDVKYRGTKTPKKRLTNISKKQKSGEQMTHSQINQEMYRSIEDNDNLLPNNNLNQGHESPNNNSFNSVSSCNQPESSVFNPSKKQIVASSTTNTSQTHNQQDTTKLEDSSKSHAAGEAKFQKLENKFKDLQKEIKAAEISQNQQQLANFETRIAKLKADLQNIIFNDDLYTSETHKLEKELILIKQKVLEMKNQKVLLDIESSVLTMKSNRTDFQNIKKKLVFSKKTLDTVEEFDYDIKIRKENIAKAINNLEMDCTTNAIEDQLNQMETKCKKYRLHLNQFMDTKNSAGYKNFRQKFLQMKDNLNQMQLSNQEQRERKDLICCNIEQSLEELERKATKNEQNKNIKAIKMYIKSVRSRVNKNNYQSEKKIFIQNVNKFHSIEVLIEDIPLKQELIAAIQVLEKDFAIFEAEHNLEQLNINHNHYRQNIDALTNTVKKQFCTKLRDKLEQINEPNLQIHDKKKKILEEVNCSLEQLEQKAIHNGNNKDKSQILGKLNSIEENDRDKSEILGKLNSIEESIAAICSNLNNQNYQCEMKKLMKHQSEVLLIEHPSEDIQVKKQKIIDNIRNLEKGLGQSTHISDTDKQFLTQLKGDLEQIRPINQEIDDKKKSSLYNIEGSVNELDREAGGNQKKVETNEDQLLEIIDVHQYFRDDFDLNNLDSFDKVEQIRTVGKWVKTFEENVKQFKETKYSLEYFVLDEKLMRFIEYLDKIKCKEEPEELKEKVKVIEEIKNLQEILDKQATED